MKLIRLSTTDKNAYFDNSYSDLTIKANSKIALQNVALETLTRKIEISPANQRIRYKFDTKTGEQFFDLQETEYTESNYQNLFDEITRKLNANVNTTPVLSSTSKSFQANQGIGQECKSFVNRNNKVEIGYKYGKEIAFEDIAGYANVDENSGEFNSSTTANTTTNANHTFSTEYIAKGGGIFHTQIRTLTQDGADINANGFIIGLTSVNPNSGISNSDIEIAIHATYNGSVYRTTKDNTGVFTDSTTNAETFSTYSRNDNVCIRISEGNLIAEVYKQDANGIRSRVELTTQPYDSETELYPFIIFRGKDTISKCRNVVYTSSPYEYIHIKGTELELEAPKPPSNANTERTVLLKFQDNNGNPEMSLAEFLGYNYDNYSVAKQKEYQFESENVFDYNDVSDAFVIELLNLDVDSYDAIGRRTNLLAVIPATDNNNNNQVIYDTKYPVFLDLKNNQDRILYNIQARILKPDLSPIITRGLSTLTILIKNPDE